VKHIQVGLLVLIWVSNPVAAQQRAFQLPTATEVFNLRSKCTALGEKIMEENLIGSALTQSQVSHYNPQTNRCYVELTVQTADLQKANYYSRSLFDGQTKEMLAFARVEKGIESGIVYDRQNKPAPLTNEGWVEASNYMDQMMADDRR
jgi:hypothetical protein